MFTVVLINKYTDEVLQKVYAVGNDFLSKEEQEDSATYPNLSEVSKCDIAFFSSNSMSSLIGELDTLKTNLNDEQKEHIGRIIELAKICEDNEDYVLFFTPFGDFLDNPIIPTKIDLFNNA